jgi:F0F1-type ATP synthase membrane subunit c/vacuolar-type H+-ATPase subunit K
VDRGRARPDEAPTLIRNPRWVRPIEPLFSFLGVVPGYGQVDISVPFLVFFGLFFAMIVGDAGYGLLFLVLTESPARRCRRRRRARDRADAGAVGRHDRVGRRERQLLRDRGAAAGARVVRLGWLTDERNVIALAFTIGAVHLTLAHVWNVVRFINTTRALVELGWVATTWTMYFLARQLVLGDPFPDARLGLFGVGVALIAAFTRPGGGCAASGSARHAAAEPGQQLRRRRLVRAPVRRRRRDLRGRRAFNALAASIGLGGVLGGVVSALVLFFGHTLNVLLAAMGVLVHGVRLNTLEFAGHLGCPGPATPTARSLAAVPTDAHGRRPLMDPEMMLSLGQAGAAAVLGLAAIGSALGTGAAGLAAVGAWKRCYALEKPVPFILVTFVGAPLSQTIYGMILMNTIVRTATERAAAGDFVGWPAMLAVGLFGGSRWRRRPTLQGAWGGGRRRPGRDRQGFGNYLMAIGVVETVALFVLVFIQARCRRTGPAAGPRSRPRPPANRSPPAGGGRACRRRSAWRRGSPPRRPSAGRAAAWRGRAR